jgi:hypothetical protein
MSDLYAGIDLGTRFTKTNTEIIFPSGMSQKINNMANNVMTINNEKYSMGVFNEKVSYDINVNKTLNKNIKNNFLYGLYLNSPEDLVMYKTVVVGLPASQCTPENTEEFKRLLTTDDTLDIDVNGFKKTIFVDNVEIVPEGSTAYYAIDYEKFDKKKVLVLDWGGLTLNQHLFYDDELIDSNTDEFGSLKIYQDMAGKINSEFGTNIKLEEIHEILINGLQYKGKTIPVRETIKDITMSHCENIYKKLKLKWDIDTIQYIPLVGGTSIVMIDYLREYIPHCYLENKPQFLSAIGMGEIARMCCN